MKALEGVDVQDVTDPDDPRLDDFRDLNSVDRRPDLPTGKGLVIAEGVLVVQRMLASRFTPHALLGTDRRLVELNDDLADVDGLAAPYYRASADVMAQVIGFHLNRGVLAAARRAPELSVAQVVDHARTVAVLEGGRGGPKSTTAAVAIAPVAVSASSLSVTVSLIPVFPENSSSLESVYALSVPPTVPALVNECEISKVAPLFVSLATSCTTVDREPTVHWYAIICASAVARSLL